MTNRSNTTASPNVPPNCRPCVFSSGPEGRNQGTDARLPDGSGVYRDNVPIPGSSPWEPPDISRWFLLSGRHGSKSKMGLAFLRSSSIASISVPPTLTCLSPYLLLHPGPPASLTSPLRLQPWAPRSQVGGTPFRRPVVCFISAVYKFRFPLCKGPKSNPSGPSSHWKPLALPRRRSRSRISGKLLA